MRDAPSVHCSTICCITALIVEHGIPRGCYKDLPVPTMEILEGKHNLLDGNKKCILVGRGRGYPIVGIQNGGRCVGSPTLKDFNKYGVSRDCKSDGKGRP